MVTLREAAEQALDWIATKPEDRTISAGRMVGILTLALEAEQQDEPVAYRHLHEDGWEYYDAPTGSDCNGCQPLYNRPQPVQQPLTQQRIQELADKISGYANNKIVGTPEAWDSRQLGADPSTARRASPEAEAALDALRQALAEQQAEPVATVSIELIGSRTTVDIEWGDRLHELGAGNHKLYIAPQPAQQPLTDKQIDAAVAPLYQNSAAQRMGRADDIATARAIERAHRITGETK